MFICQFSLSSCNPEAKWETKDVEITMTIGDISAGFVECSFSTNKEAYYLIAITPAKTGYNPMNQQKQFMTLALDSANMEYIAWRNELLKAGEFTVAPFASHALQYGDVDYIFTGLEYDTDYWIYAFVVNPEKMTPAGRLYLLPVRTTKGTTKKIAFEYRVKDRWDYTYPINESGHIEDHYPYVAATRDSLEIAESGDSPEMYFELWYSTQAANPSTANIIYGVKAICNDGWESYLEFEEGHTYYTYISGFDGFFNHHVLYKFTWKEKFQQYFKEEDSVLEENTGL